MINIDNWKYNKYGNYWARSFDDGKYFGSGIYVDKIKKYSLISFIVGEDYFWLRKIFRVIHNIDEAETTLKITGKNNLEKAKDLVDDFLNKAEKLKSFN